MSCHVITISPSIPTGESIGVKGVSTQSRLRYSERQLFFLRAELHDIFYIEVVIIQSCQVRDYRLLDNNNNNNNNNNSIYKYIDRSTTIINKDGGINAIYCSLHYSSHGMFWILILACPTMHITAHHNTSKQITTQHNTSQHSTSQHITTNHSTSQQITAQHNKSQHITTHHNTA